VRLELERVEVAARGAPLPVAHCYGHGGSGLTLAWGCAGDVVALINGALA
jgi:D-amino-acid oxidase